MQLRKIAEGQAFTVCTLELSDDPLRAPAREFLDSLTERARKAMTNLILAHAENGPLKNTSKSRSLGDGIFEFKVGTGERLLFFYGEQRTTILVNGFKKGAKVAEEKKRALAMHAQWKEAEEHGAR